MEEKDVILTSLTEKNASCKYEKLSGGSYIAAKVTGISHILNGKVCQDAWDIRARIPDCGAAVFLAVADGHGGSKYIFSEHGAAIATKTATQLMGELYFRYRTGQLAALEESAVLFDVFKHGFCGDMLKEWRKHIEKDYLQKQNAEQGQEASFNQKYYGTTLLTAMVYEGQILCGQIGDGDIFLVNKEECTRLIPEETDMLGSETRSLITPNAERFWRVKSELLAESNALVMMTDGLSNSFASDEELAIFLQDVWERIQTYEPSEVARALSTWLKDCSQRGSGDDITLLIYWKQDDSEFIRGGNDIC